MKEKANLQGFVKGDEFCFIYLDIYFQHGESTSTASQLASPATQKSLDWNKVPLLLQNLENLPVFLGASIIKISEDKVCRVYDK